jgi:hypothetical protein
VATVAVWAVLPVVTVAAAVNPTVTPVTVATFTPRVAAEDNPMVMAESAAPGWFV